jgi:hypothetical protein
MTESELLERFGVSPPQQALPTIREILRAAVAQERSRQGAGDTELMKLCCVQLFCSGEPADIVEVWRAKTSSMDADASIDIQLLCGAGLAETRAYLASMRSEEAAAALERIAVSESAGDLDGFTIAGYRAFWERYYGGDQ